MAQLPDKLYFRIGEVAAIVGVEPHVLRYWETEFRSVRPEKSRKGQRIYSRRDVDTLLKVKELLYGHRYTVAGAKRKLRGEGVEPVDDDDPTSRHAEAMRQGLLGLRVELSALRAELELL
ncbi:MAG: MerR family transcriptional regulator [Myxococcales bacterium]|nr:MerR family transcriptional regulator [Myxococcales bacterium]